MTSAITASIHIDPDSELEPYACGSGDEFAIAAVRVPSRNSTATIICRDEAAIDLLVEALLVAREKLVDHRIGLTTPKLVA